MFLPGLLRFVVCFVPFEIHQVKIDIFSIDFEKMGKRTQLPKTVLLIQMDGAGIAAAYFKIQLLKAVLLGEGKNRFHQGRCRTAAPPCFFQTDTEYSAMAHAIASSVQTCCADNLAIYLSKILRIVS